MRAQGARKKAVCADLPTDDAFSFAAAVAIDRDDVPDLLVRLVNESLIRRRRAY